MNNLKMGFFFLYLPIHFLSWPTIAESSSILQPAGIFSEKLPEGGEVRNGGDLVMCNHSIESSYHGLYSLDYLATLGMDRGGRNPLVPVKKAHESFLRIESGLRRYNSTLASDFHNFIKAYMSPPLLDSPIVWIASSSGLQNLNDERFIQQLPINCYSLDTGRPQFLQSIVRRVSYGRQFFYYDQNLLASLNQSRPQQLSFLIVHEWLWNYTQDIECSRLVNYFLHSAWLDSAPNISRHTLNCRP